MIHSKPSGWLVSLPLLLSMMPGARADSLTFGDIDALQQENIVLAQQARAAELRQRISQAGSNGANTVAVPSVSSGGAFSSPQTAAQPRLAGIQGVKGSLEARVTADGQTWTLRKGQQWPGSSIRVSDIHLDGITLSDGTRLVPGDSYEK